MSNRITMKDLEAQVKRINLITKSPLESYTKHTNGKLTANIGNYHLSGAYGGFALHRMQSSGGGITDVLGSGHTSKRELFLMIRAYIEGLRVNE